MKKTKLETQFAPAERAPEETLQRQIKLLRAVPHLGKLYGAVIEVIMILNSERQIVWFNGNLPKLLRLKNPDSLYGKRPGEALHCANANKCAGGCGTSDFCSECGAANAIMNSQKTGQADAKECRITRVRRLDALDLQVLATPFPYEGEKFTIFSAIDISHLKRRQVLEQIFFHDILNTASYLQVASDLLNRSDNLDTEEIKDVFFQGLNDLISEINNQKILASAESDDLVVKPVHTHSSEIIHELESRYRKLAETSGIKLALVERESDTIFSTDKNLLLRILGNMVTNAIEASDPGETVTISHEGSAGKICFSVKNKQYMPRAVQLQIGQRSFTTKGAGRGVGTYSMKLLASRYLKGKVSFVSNRKDGTIFIACFPIDI